MDFRAGDRRNTIRARPDDLLHLDRVRHGELRMDIREILLVLFRHALLLPLLHLLRHDDRVHHTQPPSCSHLRGRILRPLQLILGLLRPTTGKSKLTNPPHHYYNAAMVYYLLTLCFMSSENSEMVGVVLLDLPGGVDRLRPNHRAVRRCDHKYNGGRKQWINITYDQGLYSRSFWV